MKQLLLLTLAISALYSAPQAFSQKILTTIPIGGQPGYLAINTTTNMIYVPNQTLNTVTVINGNSNQVVANIPVGALPYAAAVNPVTNLIYVSLPSSSPSPSVAVIDGATNTVTATIPAAAPPDGIAANPVTNRIYFTSFSSSSSSVGIIDGATNQIVTTLAISSACCVTTVAVNTTTNRIYAAYDFSTEQVVEIDGNTNHFQMFAVPGLCNLVNIAVDSSLNRIYAPDDVCGGLYVINGADHKLVTTVLPGYGGPVTVSPTNHQIADFSVNILTFLSGQNDTVVGGSVNLPASLQALSMAANSKNRYYVSFYNSTGIAVIGSPKP
jgi:YVTN family beta-propeller protein